MTKPLLLHAHATGPNPIKIAIALESLKVPYDVQQWEFGDDPKKGVKGEAYLKINENGRLPSLQDPNTGVVAWESGACMNYIRRVYDREGKLGPAGKEEQDVVDLEKWEYFLLTNLAPMLGQVNWFRNYHEVKNQDALDRYSAQVYRCFGVLEGQLKKSNGESILPEKITAVDYHAEPWVRQYTFAGLSLDSYPLLQRWLAGMAKLEEVKRGYVKVKGQGPE
ncbi:glutathione S-transferase [Aspergillus piperis CBS 112811]|uniref:Glutathione S-transferase n=1 Tax=Aspergillus piperis CBS 112811 TaxID=1448313 RepID=A0A8G1R7D3_9EURO|nr:glutathione S-transferase [Aspergillus piperis CBS 112811]RAH60864.1 glutathione S-transferase [Aspergillus piperis CBS 112811]